MKVLLVDDESAMLLAMKMLLAKIEDVELVGAFQNASEALQFVDDREVDLAFLDIQLADDSGLELARQLRSRRPGLDIVFTTSHTEFAVQAYDVYPLDYMVKPISRMRLTQTIARAVASRTISAAQAKEQAVQHPIDRLSIRGLGCFEASSDLAGNVKWMSRKSMELFAYLLLHQGRSVSKTRVIEALFPESLFKNAEAYLYTAIYQLRKALDKHGCKQMIISAQEKYRVDLDSTDIDFVRFEQQLQHFAEITADNAAAAMQLERQFTGDLFEDISSAWAAAERERLQLLYESFARQLVVWLLEQKHYREAAQLADRLAARNAYDEQICLVQLNIYGAQGDVSSLQNRYASYKQLLREELDLSPSPLVEQMYSKYAGLSEQN